MTVLPDWQIVRDIKIEPFADGSIRPGTISYGVTSYGYDVRVDRHFKVFTNARCAVVDPKNFDPASFVDIEGDRSEERRVGKECKFSRVPLDNKKNIHYNRNETLQA